MRNEDTIRVSYQAVDGFRQTRRFKTLAGAKAYAHERIGAFPAIASGYAVSDDGVGIIRVDGVELEELFPHEEPEPAPLTAEQLAEREEAEGERYLETGCRSVPSRISGRTDADDMEFPF